MSKAENILLQNCDNVSETIIAFISKPKLALVSEFTKKESEFSGVVKVYSSIDDSLVGCYTIIEPTEDGAGDYYVIASESSLFKTCSDCNFSEKINEFKENQNVLDKLQNTRASIEDLISSKTKGGK